MAMEHFVVSIDPAHYEAWPDVVLTDQGELLCFFCETTAHGRRTYSRIMMVRSQDRGRTWSARSPLSDAIASPDGSNYWDCPRVTRLRDGRLIVVCDRVYSLDQTQGEILLWAGDPEGRAFTGPLKLGIPGIVPDRLLELSDGSWLLACHQGHVDGFAPLQVRAYRSLDQGKSWSSPATVGRDARYELCEASVIELSPGTLVALMRENSAMGYECMAARSEDYGQTWGALYTIPLACCHRPVSMRLDTGEIMITYRYRQGAQKGWLGAWTQNTFLALTNDETLQTGDRARQAVRIMPLHYDRGEDADLGYTGCVQFADGEIYVVDYIRGDAPQCHIIGTALRREDVGGRLMR